LLQRRELARVLVRHGLDDRAVARIGEVLLTLVRVQEVHELLGLRRRILGDRDRVLDQDRAVRRHVLEVDAVLFGLDGVVLVADEHVALPAGERVQRVTGARVLHRRVGKDLLDEVLRLGVGLALGDLGPVDGHDVPASSAGGGRVRVDHVDVRIREIVEAGDVLRVARTDHQGHDRVGDDSLVLILVPVGRDDAGVDQTLHVGLERELDDVGRLAGLDRAALVARGPKRVGEVDVLAVGCLLEGRLEALLVGLLWGRVRHHAERASARTARGDADSCPESDGGDPKSCYEAPRLALLLCLSHGGF
jgi:hypothetical protein